MHILELIEILKLVKNDKFKDLNYKRYIHINIHTPSIYNIYMSSKYIICRMLIIYNIY